MKNNESTISLGFTEQKFPAGVHICQIITDDNERMESLLKFLLAGLQTGERASCFSENVSETILKEFLGKNDISYNDVVNSGAFMHSGTRDIYFQDNRFDPDRMLSILKNYHLESKAQGYPGTRVIGEMLPEVQNLPGGIRLLEYESRISLLLREYPVTAVCQYDARLFEGATIMEVLKVHPWMIVRGTVVNNPFHIPPEEYLPKEYT